jgi:uncharacterized Zn finger protein
MNDKQSEVSCEGCGETFTNFLQEMADQNAKVTTCPKCGKVHPFPKVNIPAVNGRPLRKTS